MLEVRAAAKRVLELAKAQRPLFAGVKVQRLEGVRTFPKEAWKAIGYEYR